MKRRFKSRKQKDAWKYVVQVMAGIESTDGSHMRRAYATAFADRLLAQGLIEKAARDFKKANERAAKQPMQQHGEICTSGE